LAECIGEVGAIDSHRLEETKGLEQQQGKSGCSDFKLSSPPWRAQQADYGLRLVRHYLVGGLKAAATSAEQHKIGFSIQQLLVMLNESEEEEKERGAGRRNKNCDNSTVMNQSLKDKLVKGNIYDIVEPFFNSEFQEVGGISSRQLKAPFFETAAGYNQWMACWCSYMIHGAKDSGESVWKGLFYACRTTVRTPAGLGAAEFLLPLLILDRLCFGNSAEERVLLKEVRGALSFVGDSIEKSKSKMDWTDRQKAVNTVFTAIETLERWSEKEVEDRHKQRSRSRRTGMGYNIDHSDWPVDDAIMRIEDLSKAVPLPLRAKAAAKIGMNARALRLLEMASRSVVSEIVFDSAESKDNTLWKHNRSRASGVCPSSEIGLMKDVLTTLHDYETMFALDDYKHLSVDLTDCVRDTIRQKEAAGDWEGALQGYERAQQLSGHQRDPFCHRGALKCLLELGHFESVLNQVSGVMHLESTETNSKSNNEIRHAIALGSEAGECNLVLFLLFECLFSPKLLIFPCYPATAAVL